MPLIAATPIALASTVGSQSSCLLTASLTRTSASVRAAVVTIAFFRACESATKLPRQPIADGATWHVAAIHVPPGSLCRGDFERASLNGRTPFYERAEILRSCCEFFPEPTIRLWQRSPVVVRTVPTLARCVNQPSTTNAPVNRP